LNASIKVGIRSASEIKAPSVVNSGASRLSNGMKTVGMLSTRMLKLRAGELP